MPDPDILDLNFPSSFFWGASTSAHQVEGDNQNDWSEWEQSNAKRLARESVDRYGNRLASWEKIAAQAQNPQNYISGKAADHYHLYAQDFDLLKSLGLNSYRFSIEWSRVEPEFGKFNDQEIDHYRRVIGALRERDIEPFVTLWHWTIPTWFRDRGGWANKDAARYFADFVSRIVGCCIDADYWITLNEPEIYVNQSYLAGEWPPQRKSYLEYFNLLNALIHAHNYVTDAVRQLRPGAKLGVAHNITRIEATPDNFLNRLGVKVVNWWTNRYLLDRVIESSDFVGLNYYFRRYLNITPFAKKAEPTGPLSDMGWELYPEGIYHVLKGLQKYKKPVFITEHGLADADDKLREWYIVESLRNVQKAMQENVDVRGYFHWSLLDNFEWDKGFWPRFGLVEVDFETQERKVRESAKRLGEIIQRS